jgi:hypothetical protein
MLNVNSLNELIESVKTSPLTIKSKFDNDGSKCFCVDVVLTKAEAAKVDAMAIRKHDQGRTVKLGFDNEYVLVATRGTHNGTRLAYRFQAVQYAA